MSVVDINAGGPKDAVEAQLEADLELHEKFRVALKDMVESLPGTHVSVSGDLRLSQEGLSGSLELRVSFWTEKSKA